MINETFYKRAALVEKILATHYGVIETTPQIQREARLFVRMLDAALSVKDQDNDPAQ